MTPSARSEFAPVAATTMWSWRVMPSFSATVFTSRVISMSAADGVGSPEGWLWTRISAVAPSSNARLITLARIQGRVIDGAPLLLLVGDQLVLAVEEEDAEALDRLVGEAGAAIIDERRPRRQHRPVGDAFAQHPPARLAACHQIRAAS
jgi:hypothetical protein